MGQFSIDLRRLKENEDIVRSNERHLVRDVQKRKVDTRCFFSPLLRTPQVFLGKPLPRPQGAESVSGFPGGQQGAPRLPATSSTHATCTASIRAQTGIPKKRDLWWAGCRPRAAQGCLLNAGGHSHLQSPPKSGNSRVERSCADWVLTTLRPRSWAHLEELESSSSPTTGKLGCCWKWQEEPTPLCAAPRSPFRLLCLTQASY